MAASLCFSCATVSRAPSRPTAEIFGKLAKNGEKRTAVSGNLLVTSELGGHSVTAPAVLLVEWPDKLRLELQDPVGGVLALLVMNGDQFWLFEANRPEILMGPVKKMPRGMMPSLASTDLVRIFLARPDLERARRGELGEGRSVFREKSVVETLTWTSDAEPAEWSRVVAGSPATAASFDDYEFKSGLHYPTKIRLLGMGPDGKDRKIFLAWKDWDVSVPKEKKLFQIPQQTNFGRKIKALP